MEKAILVNSTVDVRRLMEIDITKATKHLQGLEPPISPMAFAVCMRAWNVLECLFTHAGLFGPQAMQALKQLPQPTSVPQQYEKLCRDARAKYYKSMVKMVLKPIRHRLHGNWTSVIESIHLWTGMPMKAEKKEKMVAFESSVS